MIICFSRRKIQWGTIKNTVKRKAPQTAPSVLCPIGEEETGSCADRQAKLSNAHGLFVHFDVPEDSMLSDDEFSEPGQLEDGKECHHDFDPDRLFDVFE